MAPVIAGVCSEDQKKRKRKTSDCERYSVVIPCDDWGTPRLKECSIQANANADKGHEGNWGPVPSKDLQAKHTQMVKLPECLQLPPHVSHLGGL